MKTLPPAFLSRLQPPDFKAVAEQGSFVARKGKPKSADHRARIGEATRNRTQTADTRAKIGAASSNRSAETLAKISLTQLAKTAAKLGVTLEEYQGLSRYHRKQLSKNARAVDALIAAVRLDSSGRPGVGRVDAGRSHC